MKRALLLGLMVLPVAALILVSENDRAGAGGVCTIRVNAADENLSPDGNVSLREAIAFATDVFDPQPAELGQISGCPAPFDDNPGVETQDIINFDPSVFPSGSPTTINLGGSLPPLSAGNDTVRGSGYGVIVDGGGADPCFSITSSGNQIDGVEIHNCGVAILVEGQEGMVMGSRGPQANPVAVPADDNKILYNFIGSNETGIKIGVEADDNIVAANRIGTNSEGDVADPNGTGILVESGTDNRIGGPGGFSGGRQVQSGPAEEEGNLISGNTGNGLVIEGGMGTAVLGNRIGTNRAGDAALPNGGIGVVVVSSTGNVIGSVLESGANVISGNAQNGVHIFGDGNLIEGNLIGLNAAGTGAIPNGIGGVVIQNGESNVVDLNVISGNESAGVEICCDMADDNTVINNFIGTNAAGDSPIGNGDHGIRIEAPRGNIGGPGLGNVISGNEFGGVLLLGQDAVDNWVQGNRIGVAADSELPIPNNGYGVAAIGSGPNLIGGTNFDSEGNLIANNTGEGVGVTMFFGASTGKRILRNSIYANGGLGIDLEQDGATLNDNLDPDTGGNGRQNYPVLSSASADGGLTIEGTLNSTANTGFEIQFFANSECDPSGLGEGEDYVGSAVVTTDGSGNVAFSEDFPPFAGQFVTATATSPDGNTSEFSGCVEIESSATPTPSPTPTPGPTATPTPTPSPTAAPGGILGDTDCDEDVDAVDALHVLQDVAGFDPDADCLAQGDVQCDGDRDAVDALGILTHIAALPPQPQEPGCPAVGDQIV